MPITPCRPKWAGTMTDRERFVRQMHYAPVDRCFNMEFGYWDDNFEVWPIDEIQFCWGGTCWLCPVESYDAEYDGMRAWAEARLDWMDEHIGNWWTGEP